MFLQIGGEGTADPIWMTTGAWVTYGKMYNAMLFQVEHRYYGKSHPVRYGYQARHTIATLCIWFAPCLAERLRRISEANVGCLSHRHHCLFTVIRLQKLTEISCAV